MPALKHYILDLDRRDETCADISSDVKHFIPCFRKRTFCILCLGLRDFTMLCNDDEHKRMGQGREY
jgi:hypothetical protein